MANGSLPPGFEEFEFEEVSESPRDRCARRLSDLKKNDVVTVGKSRWKIWRSTGITNIVTKAGTKGRKLYDLHVTDIERCCIEVREISPGMGEWLGKPAVAKGCTNGGDHWKGALGRARKRRKR